MSPRADGQGGPTGWRCRVCGQEVPIGQALSWRCPNASAEDRYHVLRLVLEPGPLRARAELNPFRAFQRYLAVDAFAAANGVPQQRRVEVIERTDALVRAVAGTGFVRTPFARADELSDALAFDSDGGIWIKDETGNVAGSHKGRHLFTVLLHLLVAEEAGIAGWSSPADRPPLAIASCGNAALAATTLAAAVDWPIEVFVPPSADPVVVEQLGGLGATIVRCPRQDGDPPGDPCVHRFREAVGRGSIPFGVQGTENAWGLDGGRTIGWEMARHFDQEVDGPPLDRLFVQVGGGALADCVGSGFAMSGIFPRFHAVQTEGCAPLARAWALAVVRGGPRRAASRWPELMWPWEREPRSAADGILDDETYDWLGIFDAMASSGGTPVVAAERHVLAANELARRYTAIDASHTGTAGLAGLLEIRDSIAADERVAVIFSGIRRS